MARFVAMALITLLALPTFSCSTPTADPPPADPPPPPAYESPYDWSRLTYANGRFTYNDGWVPASLTGIDVSEHNKEIDWSAVAADGIDFVIIRIGYRGYTEGKIYEDTFFEEYYAGARSVGLRIGVYFFSQAITWQEAVEEAKFVVKTLGKRSLDYPVFFDHEPVADSKGRANHLTGAQLSVHARAFCEYIEEHGYVPMLYGNMRDVGKIDARLRDRYGVWFAHFGAQTPGAQFDFIIWQYTETGRVAGVKGVVDLNIHFLYP